MNCSATLLKNPFAKLAEAPGEQEEKDLFHAVYPRKKIIVIAGPTGSGKSALSMMLADAGLPIEIVSADSMQVYRGMDIGTAKVSKEERERVPHHVIDIRDVTQGFNVVDFFFEARQACQAITRRGNIPVVVGGAGFYLDALLYGPPTGPASDPVVRKALEEDMEKQGPGLMYDRLQKLDPVYASTITSHDKHKIVRGLEIIAITGKEVSKNQWREKKKYLNYDFRCWFVHRPRSSLYHRVEKRCDKMLADGLLEEVAQLDKLGIRSNPTAAQAIGYKQSLEFLDSSQTKEDYNKFLEGLYTATRHYVKRQLTWFRPDREPGYRWLDLDMHDPETAVDIIIRDYESRPWRQPEI